MRSLGRLVRGLSALFWGLPVALVICFHTARAAGGGFGILPPIAACALMLYGLWLTREFQPNERPWRRTLDNAILLAMVNMGLSPFLYWWGRVPSNDFFTWMVLGQILAGLLFLGALNLVLQRLGGMLPDEALRL